MAVLQDELELALWPWPSGRAWVILGGLLEVCCGVPFAYPTFLSVAYYMSCLSFEIVLYDMLVDAADRADTPAKIKEVR